jgi:hypothetical protein
MHRLSPLEMLTEMNYQNVLVPCEFFSVSQASLLFLRGADVKGTAGIPKDKMIDNRIISKSLCRTLE